MYCGRVRSLKCFTEYRCIIFKLKSNECFIYLRVAYFITIIYSSKRHEVNLWWIFSFRQVCQWIVELVGNCGLDLWYPYVNMNKMCFCVLKLHTNLFEVTLCWIYWILYALKLAAMQNMQFKVLKFLLHTTIEHIILLISTLSPHH